METPTPIKDLLTPALRILQTPAGPPDITALGAFKTEQGFKNAVREHFAPFETMDDPQLMALFNAAYDFLHAMVCDQPPYWLTFLGSSGAGKTMLVKLIASFFAKRLDGRLVPSLSSDKRHVRANGGMLQWYRCMDAMIGDHDYGFMAQAREDWLVAIDDVGVEYKAHRDMSASKLYDILTSRDGKWSIFTANLSVAQIGELLDMRIASRLLRHGAVVVDVLVPDFNLRQR